MSKKETNEKTVKKETDEKKVIKEKFDWTTEMDDAFIQAMLTQQDKGNRPNGTFTSRAYTNMVNELRKNLNLPFTKSRLKNRLRTIKEHFAQCYDVIHGSKLSGFSWNASTQFIEAEEEIWEQLIEVCISYICVYYLFKCVYIMGICKKLYLHLRKYSILPLKKNYIRIYW